MHWNETTTYTPSYILRRRIILHLLRTYEPGRFLEIGCGQGELLPRLARLGFEGVGLEISPQVIPKARQVVHPYEPKLSIATDVKEIEGQRFRYVFAFEVLEHIHDDAGALVDWRKWLAPGGRLILTVPAHIKRWSASDDAVGHYRRYEHDGLSRLLMNSGYVVEVFWSYGFPLINLTRPVRNLLYRCRFNAYSGLTKEDRTLLSSETSTITYETLSKRAHNLTYFMETLGLTFHMIQLPFRQCDFGDGYLVACRPSSSD